MKNRKSTEKLIQAVQLRADATLRHCAILNNDARILALTSRDIVATEAHYHASCYKSYTNIKTKERDHVGDKEMENSSQVADMLSYEVVEVEAYVQLIKSETMQFHIRRSYQLPSLPRNWKHSCPGRVKLSKPPQRRTSVKGLNQNWTVLSIFSQMNPESCC